MNYQHIVCKDRQDRMESRETRVVKFETTNFYFLK